MANRIINAAGLCLDFMKKINVTPDKFFLEDRFGTIVTKHDNNFIVKGDHLIDSLFLDKVFELIIQEFRPRWRSHSICTAKELGLKTIFKNHLYLRSNYTWVYEKIGSTIYQGVTSLPLPIKGNTFELSDLLLFNSDLMEMYYSIGNASTLTKDTLKTFESHLFLYKIVLEELSKQLELFKEHYKVILYVDGNKTTVIKVQQGELNGFNKNGNYLNYGISTLLDYIKLDSFKPERNVDKIMYAVNTNLENLSCRINERIKDRKFDCKMLLFRYNITPGDSLKITKEVFSNNNVQFIPYIELHKYKYDLASLKNAIIDIEL